MLAGKFLSSPKILLSVLFSFVATLSAAPTQCGGIYFGNEAPDIINTKLLSGAREICYSEFAVTHSAKAKSPLWSAEHLLGSQLSIKIDRSNDFFAETKLSPDERSELSDFAGSSYDRGHLSNARDRHTLVGEHESFSLANMVMQDPVCNRGVFSAIEEATRQLAKKEGEIYVITGPLFIGENIKRVKGRVLVPTQIFKAIYIPSSGRGAAYLVENDASGKYQVLSIDQIERMSGIRLFPKMSPSLKQNAINFPLPVGRGQNIAMPNRSISEPKATKGIQQECGSKRTCREMSSCAEAKFYLAQCGVSSLDGDGDGTPCEKLCR